MTAPRFIQVHTLTAYPASLLNRDDAGLAKRIPFGGVSRTRISSQCLKRHWRTAQDAHALRNVGLEMAVRSRVTLSRKLIQPLVAAGLPQDRLEAALEGMLKGGLFQEAEAKRSARAKAGDEDDAKEPFVTGQVTVLGDPELTYLRDVLRELAAAAGSEEEARKQGEARVKAERQNLRALRNGAGLDAAMFGRMVTSDILARKNAAVHVAHAFTVHAEESESDYFTAVDDLLTGVEETGSGHIGETELTSGLFYGYVVVDLPQLVCNLAGKEDEVAWQEAWRADAHRDDRALAAQVTGHLLHLIAKVSPGAKLGSTAPYSWAQLVLLEAGDRQPRTLANAFLNPVRANGGSGLAAAAVQALAANLGALDGMYGAGERRWLASAIEGDELPGASRLPFDEAVRAVVDTIGE
jgi:CRISPR system Cascade subunit CasC